MNKTAVLNIVGLTSDLIGDHTPFLKEWFSQGKVASIQSMLPAVTCSVQATYLTGEKPSKHGIVANGWYFQDTSEVRFWMRSGKLMQGEKIWDRAKQEDSSFSCANLFWRYATYSGADYTVIERPMYRKDGVKVPDIYANPMSLRDELQEKLGQFPLFNFWGPNTSIKSSRWIANAAKIVTQKYDPTLSLVYIPHMDYNLQRVGPDDPVIKKDMQKVDELCEDLVSFYEEKERKVIILSEYGISSVDKPVHLNRVLRKEGYITVREELGGEVFDAGASQAFAVADHQVAHIYVEKSSEIEKVKELLGNISGVERILGQEGQKEMGIDHPRSGELVAIAEPGAWFTYYYWLDDHKAPDFAPTVSIHDKPGYDPAEMLFDPDIRFPKLKAAGKLLQKKLGFRYTMDLIPTNGKDVRGSHGRVETKQELNPLIATQQSEIINNKTIQATDVQKIIYQHLFSN